MPTWHTQVYAPTSGLAHLNPHGKPHYCLFCQLWDRMEVVFSVVCVDFLFVVDSRNLLSFLSIILWQGLFEGALQIVFTKLFDYVVSSLSLLGIDRVQMF